MREASLGGLKVRLVGGSDGRGGGDGPVVILLHGFGAPGDDLVPLADVIHVPRGTRWLFPEAPLSLNMGFGDSRAWWIIDFARIQADREAGRIRDLSVEVPQGLALARERILAFLKELPKQFPLDYKKTVIGGFSQAPCSPAMLCSTPIIRSLVWRSCLAICWPRTSGVR